MIADLRVVVMYTRKRTRAKTACSKYASIPLCYSFAPTPPPLSTSPTTNSHPSATTGPDYAAWQEETGRSFDTSNCDHQVFKYGEPTTLEYAAQKRTENILKAMNVQPVLGKRPAPQPDSPSLPPKKARRFDLVPGSEDSP